MIYYRRKKKSGKFMSLLSQRSWLGTGSFTDEEIDKMTNPSTPNNIRFPDEVLNTYDQWLLHHCGFEPYQRHVYAITRSGLRSQLLDDVAAYKVLRQLVWPGEQESEPEEATAPLNNFMKYIVGNSSVGQPNTLVLDDPMPDWAVAKLMDAGYIARRI